jgi:hypothetical protein
MKNSKHGLALAAKEHLASGQPLTRLEGMIFFGVANLPDVVKEMRREGWVIQSRKILFAAAVRRINLHATLSPPATLPVREIELTEYWIAR